MHTVMFHLLRGCALLFLAVMVLWPTVAPADLTFSAEVRESYEDNVIGLTADNPNVGVDIRGGGGQTMGGMNLKGRLDNIPGGGSAGTVAGVTRQKGDFSTSLYADIGWDYDLADAAGLLLLVSAEHKAYSTYNEFDFTIGSLSAGVTHQFSEMLTGRIGLNVSRKDFHDSFRDSTAFGATASLKEHLAQAFWLKELLDIEQNKSQSSIYDYTGFSAGIRAGYDISDLQSVSAGYSYLVRDFKDSAPSFKLTSQVVSLDWVLELNDNWTVLAGYNHEKADSNIANTATSNNIYTAGIRYDY